MKKYITMFIAGLAMSISSAALGQISSHFTVVRRKTGVS